MNYIQQACCEVAAELAAQRLKDHKVEADVGPVIFGEHMITVSARVVLSRQAIMDAIGPAIIALLEPIGPSAVDVEEAIDDHATVSVVLEVETAEALRHLRAGVDSALDDLTPKGEGPPSKEEIDAWHARIWKVRRRLDAVGFEVRDWPVTFEPDDRGHVSRWGRILATTTMTSGQAANLVSTISGAQVHRTKVPRAGRGELEVEIRIDLWDEQLGEPIRAAAKRGEG